MLIIGAVLSHMNTVLHTDREFLFNDLGKTDVHPRGKKDKANDDFLFSLGLDCVNCFRNL